MKADNPELVSTPPPVRPAADGDVSAIQGLALDNRMFTLDEMGDFGQMLEGFLDGSMPEHRWIVAEDEAGQVGGAASYAPESFADRVWNLHFLAVRPDLPRSGIGTTLVAHIEKSLRGSGEQVARVLLVEISSADDYATARAFYARAGFQREARIREFYGRATTRSCSGCLCSARAPEGL